MTTTDFNKVNKHYLDLRRSGSKAWLIEAAYNNPNVIIVCFDKQEVIDFNSIYLDYMNINGLVHKNSPELVSMEDDLTGLNMKGKPIIFSTLIFSYSNQDDESMKKQLLDGQ